jgi:transposase
LEHYVPLDVSLKEVSVCILDEKGDAVLEGKTPADLSALADLIRSKAPDVVRLGLETGATAPWLYHALTAAGLPVICMDARHANAALSMRPRKSDRSDARGLADIPADGLVSRSQGKSIPAHERRALLATRHHLVTMRTELDAQLRGLLKTFGLILGPGNTDVLVGKAEELSQGLPVVETLVTKLAEVRRHVVMQVAALDREIRHLVRGDETITRISQMTVNFLVRPG